MKSEWRRFCERLVESTVGREAIEAYTDAEPVHVPRKPHIRFRFFHVPDMPPGVGYWEASIIVRGQRSGMLLTKAHFGDTPAQALRRLARWHWGTSEAGAGALVWFPGGFHERVSDADYASRQSS